MKKILILLLSMALLPSCVRPLFDKPGREGADDPRVRPAAPDSTRGKLAVYATAVVFPDTVDWRAGGTYGCRLVLFRNGVAVDTLDRYVQPGPEKSHYQDGHLWTNTTDGFQTNITCDGNLLFSYPGEEKMMGFLVTEGTVHTLGQRPGGGICYRVNGQEVFSSAKGVVVGGAFSPDWEGGALCRDGSDVYYTYALPVSTETADMWEYRVMKGAETRKMIPALQGSRVYDVRVYRDSVYRLEYRYGRMCYLKEEELRPMDLPASAREMSLVRVDGRMRVRGVHEEGHAFYMWIRDADSLVTQFCNPHGQHVAQLFTEDGEQAVVSCDYEDCVRYVIRDTVSVDLPLETFRLHTAACARYRKGTIAVALTADDPGGDNLLVVNTEKKVLSFNGYFTGIYFE